MPESRVHHLIYVDDRPCSACRPCSLNYALFKRDDIVPILLRTDGEDYGSEYLEVTRNLHRFHVDLEADLICEANRFRSWCAARDIKPDSFCCMSEPRQEYWQAFARELELVGLPADVTRALRHKPTMKDWIRRAGLPTAEYAEVSNIDEILGFAEMHGYPIVLKPVDGWGALATSLIHREVDVKEHAASLSTRSMMVEAYIADCEYECCALIAKGKVLDIFPSIMPAPPIEAARGALNANISIGGHRDRVPVEDLHGVIQQLVDHFCLPHGYLHLEFFASENGAQFNISELALRYPGCEIAKNHGLAYGFDIARATIDTYLGIVPELHYSNIRCVGDLLLPYKPGHIRRLSTSTDLCAMPSVIEAHVGVRLGDVLPDVARASFNCSGWVLVEGATPLEVERRMKRILAQYVIEVER